MGQLSTLQAHKPYSRTLILLVSVCIARNAKDCGIYQLRNTFGCISFLVVITFEQAISNHCVSLYGSISGLLASLFTCCQKLGIDGSYSV